MGDTYDYLRMFARLPFSLRCFLRHRMTLAEAQAIIHRGMEEREANFLRLVERGIYNYPASPYLPLLRLARCELGDLRNLVTKNGLECALVKLYDAGVYITFEEFKGRKPIVRNGLELPVRARDFDNPHMRRDLTMQTGGSSGAAVSVSMDFEFIAARVPHYMVAYAAYGLLDVPIVRWTGIFPSTSLRAILKGASYGQALEHWCSPRGLRDSKHWIKYALATYYVIFWMKAFGARVPLPKYVRIDKAEVVARYVAEVLKTSPQCILSSSISQCLRVFLAAQQAGLDLKGTAFSGYSEPPTRAKVQPLVDAGMKFLTSYSMVEANIVGMSCASPVDVSDVHLCKDAFALFTKPYAVPGFDVTVPAFNLTALLPTTSKLMLNVQVDDYGIVEERHCDCELESYGYTTHLREIHSYSKLVGEGVTLVGNDLLGILERDLPGRFGGSALDYQFLEQEDETGFTRLYLVISPRVEIADESLVIEFMLRALSESSPMADAARTIWQQTKTIQIKRMEPVLTARGKLLPLHIMRHGTQAT